MVKAGDLPIYNSLIDESKEYILVPKPDSKLRSGLHRLITPTRQSVMRWYGATETNAQKSARFLVENSMAICRRVHEDPVVLARAGFIMVCGLGGVVLGGRGVLRQFAYGGLGVGFGTVMCYPSSSLKAMDYAWDSTTSKLIEASEVIKRKYKR
nr:expressed conserved protein [Echinococcus granulosus]